MLALLEKKTEKNEMIISFSLSLSFKSHILMLNKTNQEKMVNYDNQLKMKSLNVVDVKILIKWMIHLIKVSIVEE